MQKGVAAIASGGKRLIRQLSGERIQNDVTEFH
jgi:hypothetical protein